MKLIKEKMGVILGASGDASPYALGYFRIFKGVGGTDKGGKSIA